MENQLDENDDDLFEIEEGNDALRAYAENLTDDQKEKFLERLKDDEVFAELMRDAIDEINNFFTLAAVSDDDDFDEAREEIINDIDNPEESIHELRMFYLENQDEIDVSVLLSTSDDEVMFANRLQGLLSIYEEKHGG
jgi:hypothetical protein